MARGAGRLRTARTLSLKACSIRRKAADGEGTAMVMRALGRDRMREQISKLPAVLGGGVVLTAGRGRGRRRWRSASWAFDGRHRRPAGISTSLQAGA